MTARIILTLIGFVFSGPMGALIGFFIGLFLDHVVVKNQASGRPDTAWHWRQMINQPFVRSTFILMGYLAKADGQVTTHEIKIASEAMQQFRLSETQRHQAMRWFYDGKNQQFQLATVLQQLALYCQTPFISLLTRCLIQITYANGAPPIEKQRLLQEIFARLNIVMPESQYNGSTNTTYAATGSLTAAYQTLGIKPEVDVATVRKAYRRLLNKFHPDKLAAKGSDATQIKAASDKTIKIRQAYEAIMRAKGEPV